MMARYYAANVGRFLSTDPALTPEKNLVTPQRWNRYVYALNNPMKYFDPDGRDVELSSQGRDRAVRKMLVQTLMRPTGRAALQRIDSDHNLTVTFKDVRINSKQQIQSAVQAGGSLTSGVTKLEGEQVNPQTGQTLRDVSVSMDTRAIQQAHPDPSGVTTTAHESYHVEGYRQGQTDAQVKAGDKPTPSTGPAATFGKSVASEKPDLSRREAKRLLRQILKN